MPVPDQDATPPGWDEGWERAWDARRAAGTAPGLVPVRVVPVAGLEASGGSISTKKKGRALPFFHDQRAYGSASAGRTVPVQVPKPMV